MIRRLLLISLCLTGQVLRAQQSLPVLHLTGGPFGYDYAEAQLVFVHPDSAHADTLAAKVKWRGATTNGADKHKRNYKLKLSDDHRFLGMRSDDNWILDAGQADLFRLRNRIANDLWNSFATPPYYHDQKPNARSGARGSVVEVFVNNEYQGIYNLQENIDRKQMKVKKIDSLGIHGALWKANGWGASMFSFIPTSYDNTLETWDNFEVKYPEPGDDSETTDYRVLYEAVSFVIRSSNTQFCQQVADYFDIPVIIDYYLFINVLGAVDNIGKNIMWAVHDQQQDRKLTPAIWDLDATVGQRWLANFDPKHIEAEYDITQNNRLFYRLRTLNPDDFCEKVFQRYDQLRKTVFNTDSLKALYSNYYNLLQQTGAAQRETQRWSGDSDIEGATLDFAQELDYINAWFDRHMSFMDGLISQFSSSQLGIEEHVVRTQDKRVFNLKGQRIGSNTQLQPGIYIVNGRKTLVAR